MTLPFFLQDSKKYSSYCAEGHTPVCRGLPQFDLSHQERGHTLHTVGYMNKQPSQRQLTLASQQFSVSPLLLKLSEKQHSRHSLSITLIWDPVSAGLIGVFSAAEVKALQTLIRLAADAAE